MKRTWVSYDLKRDWTDAEQDTGKEFLRELIQVKKIWIPIGRTMTTVPRFNRNEPADCSYG